MSKLLNDLNVSFETAKAALKGCGSVSTKSLSINSVVPEEAVEILHRRLEHIVPQKNHRQRKKNKSTRKNKKNVEKPSTCLQYMKKPSSFNYCQSLFFDDKQPPKQVLNIRKALQDLLGEEYVCMRMPLFRTIGSITKTRVVKYKYYYYSVTGRRRFVKEECFATWILCVLSEAVNKGKISKIDYCVFVKTNKLLEVLKSKKNTNKPASKRPWVSVVSVPFGGMNRR